MFLANIPYLTKTRLVSLPMARNSFTKASLDTFKRTRSLVRFNTRCVRLVMSCISFSTFTVIFTMRYFTRSALSLMLNARTRSRSFSHLALSSKASNLPFRSISFHASLTGRMKSRACSCFVTFKTSAVTFLAITWIFLMEMSMISLECNFRSFWRVLFIAIKDLLYIRGARRLRLNPSSID